MPQHFPRPVLVLALVSAAASVPLASSSPENRDSGTTKLIEAHRAIERVYWSHREWPESNPGAKPPLSEVLPEAALRERAEDARLKSAALERFWNRPITPAQLQAEMDRMARATRRPEVLRELFAGLDGDPWLVAETLARPLLAGRLVREAFEQDRRIDRARLEAIRAELESIREVEDLQGTSGRYVVTRWQLASGDEPSRRHGANGAMLVGRERWQATRARLRVAIGDAASPEPASHTSEDRLPVGRIGPLRQGRRTFSVTTVLEDGGDLIVTAAAVWDRESFDDWWVRERRALSPLPIEADDGGFVLPAILGTPCADDTWAATPGGADPRYGHTAIWTGSEMIVWGGSTWLGESGTGSRYRPATDTWSAVSTTNAPSPRSLHTAVWTGQEMIVWGGGLSYNNDGGHYNPTTDSWAPTGGGTQLPAARREHGAIWGAGRMVVWGGVGTSGTDLNTGGVYNPLNPSSFRWTTMTTVNAPSARAGHTAVWAGTGVSGTEMIVWGGRTSSPSLAVLDTGGRYNVGANTWAATNTTGAPAARQFHTAVWTGTEMITWGGRDATTNRMNTGGRYNPTSNSWTATSTGANVPSAREFHSAIWVTGTEMIVWGGTSAAGFEPTGGRYDPTTNTWTATPTGGLAPLGRDQHTAVWATTEMIVWGGRNTFVADIVLNSGARFDPFSFSWTPTSAPGPLPRSFHTSVWTGSEMILYGGYDGTTYGLLLGYRYDPATDSWATINFSIPARSFHTAIWTGTEMIAWGGSTNGSDRLSSGRRYNPTSGAWSNTNPASGLVGRSSHAAVWTGREMLIWGGVGILSTLLGDGSRYDPALDSWTVMSGVGAPTARWGHSGVWTGSDLIVWGGWDAGGRVNTGGRYDTATDSWTATGTGAGVPAARHSHTAVWTGGEMVVWGGNSSGSSGTNTGGRYDPSTDGWNATSTAAGAPSARLNHTAVWNREEMIVWGGFNATGARYDPGTDAWTATSTVDAPSSRGTHTAVWSGEEMLVWGGTPLDSVGGRYCACTSAVPAGTPSLMASQPSAGTVRLSWPAVTGATSYDLVSGLLSTLRSGGGDYSLSTDRCLLNTAASTTYDDATAAPAGDAFWYLARPANCGGAGSYGSPTRDAQIVASGFACP